MFGDFYMKIKTILILRQSNIEYFYAIPHLKLLVDIEKLKNNIRIVLMFFKCLFFKLKLVAQNLVQKCTLL